MYNECISCQKLGVSCDGPNFVAMSSAELIEWCKLRKAHLRLTNAKLAELSDVPKGTVDRLLSGDHTGFQFTTIRPILQVLVGGSFDGNPCPAPKDNTSQHLEAIIRQQKDTIVVLESEKDTMYSYFVEKEKRMRKWIVLLCVVIVLLLIIVISALIVDKLNPEKGFFWTVFGGHARYPLFNTGI